GLTAAKEVALDRVRELCEVGVAGDPAELAFGFEHAGCGPAQPHLTRAPVFDVALGATDDLDHRLARVRRGERDLQPACDLQSRERECLLEALPQRPDGAGGGALELLGEWA